MSYNLSKRCLYLICQSFTFVSITNAEKLALKSVTFFLGGRAPCICVKVPFGRPWLLVLLSARGLAHPFSAQDSIFIKADNARESVRFN